MDNVKTEYPEKREELEALLPDPGAEAELAAYYHFKCLVLDREQPSKMLHSELCLAH